MYKTIGFMAAFAVSGCASMQPTTVNNTNLPACTDRALSSRLFAQFAEQNGYQTPAYAVNASGDVTFVDICKSATETTQLPADTMGIRSSMASYTGVCIITNDRFLPKAPITCPHIN